MPILEILLGLLTFGVALVVVPVVFVALATLLLEEEPEIYVADPVSLRSLLRG